MILITGAAGFVGRSLSRQMLERQIPFRAYPGDVNDFERLRSALADVQTVIHLAGAESRGRRRWLAYSDVEGTATLIKAVRFRPVQRIVFLSRLNAAPNTLFPLLQAKGLAEQTIRQSGIPYTILRSATLYGIEDRFTNAIAATAAWSWPIVWIPGSGAVAMQPLWVEDIGRCLIQAAQRDDLRNQTLNLVGAERLHYNDIVMMTLEAAGLRRRVFHAPTILARFANRMTTWAWSHPPLNPFDHDRLSTPEVGPLDTVPALFGFAPARLQDHLTHLRRGVYRKLFR